MNVNGEYRLPASPDRVWEALRDAETLRACIPGCQEVERLGDGEYRGRLTAQVGAVTTSYDARAVLSEETPVRNWVVSAHLESPTAGSAEGEATVTLTPEGADTIVSYRARIEPGGRLASVGPRLLNGVAIRMANEFFTRLIERLAPAQPGTEPIDLAEPIALSTPRRGLSPIAPTSAPSSGPLAASHPGSPPPVSQSVPGLAYQGEQSARASRVIVIIGLVLFLLIVALIWWPRA